MNRYTRHVASPFKSNCVVVLSPPAPRAWDRSSFVLHFVRIRVRNSASVSFSVCYPSAILFSHSRSIAKSEPVSFVEVNFVIFSFKTVLRCLLFSISRLPKHISSRFLSKGALTTLALTLLSVSPPQP
nr:PREDICTED: uncharacterized protein LOC109041715 isoform X2 [Bemisia tabaci]